MTKYFTFHKVFGFILIILGIISYILPIPGSTFLVIFGLIWLLGRKKALHFLKSFRNKVYTNI